MPHPPQVADTAPVEPFLTGYDEQNLVTYLRLLDADAEGADWREVASIVLKINPKKQPQRAKRVWESHLARAKWMTETGYRHLQARRQRNRDAAQKPGQQTGELSRPLDCPRRVWQRS
jgi:Uncharacterized conserved protein (DUF2285)